MDKYRIAKDSPVTRVTVGSNKLRAGDDEYVSLSKKEVEAVKATGAKLEVEKSTNS